MRKFLIAAGVLVMLAGPAKALDIEDKAQAIKMGREFQKWETSEFEHRGEGWIYPSFQARTVAGQRALVS